MVLLHTNLIHLSIGPFLIASLFSIPQCLNPQSHPSLSKPIYPIQSNPFNHTSLDTLTLIIHNLNLNDNGPSSLYANANQLLFIIALGLMPGQDLYPTQTQSDLEYSPLDLTPFHLCYNDYFEHFSTVTQYLAILIPPSASSKLHNALLEIHSSELGYTFIASSLPLLSQIATKYDLFKTTTISSLLLRVTLVPNQKARQGVLKLLSTKQSAWHKVMIICLFYYKCKIICEAPAIESNDRTCLYVLFLLMPVQKQGSLYRIYLVNMYDTCSSVYTLSCHDMNFIYVVAINHS